jgi:4-hydroxybenzoate polyprenyltransferase
VDTILLVLSLVVYQSYGFLVNDYFDLPYDMMVGKEHGLGLSSTNHLAIEPAGPAPTTMISASCMEKPRVRVLIRTRAQGRSLILPYSSWRAEKGHMGIFAGIAGLRAWRGALFTANIHICLLAVFYLLLAVPFSRSSLDISLLVGSLVLYQSYGFLVNDYFDFPYDMRAGKDHGLSKFREWQIILLLIALATANVILCLIVEHSLAFILLMLISYVLATLYSAPPVRFKGRGIIGFIVDASIEKMLPVLLVFSFFEHYGTDTILFSVLVNGLQFNTMMEQQIDDCEADANVGVRTLVVGIGKDKAQKILHYVLYPLNVISIVLLVALIGLWAPTARPGETIGSAIVLLGFLGLCMSKRVDRIAHDVAEQKFLTLARLLYNSRQMPFGIAYLNAGFEGGIILALGTAVALRSLAYSPLTLIYAGSLYYYSGLYIILATHLAALTGSWVVLK